jgi:peroxiredoxin
VNGTIKGAANLDVVFSQILLNNTPPVSLSKATADKDGHFAITLKEPLKEGIYQLQIGAKRIAFPMDGTEKKLTMNSDLSSFDRMDCKFEGAPSASIFVDFMKKIIADKKVDHAESDKIINEANPMVSLLTVLQFGREYKPEEYLERLKNILSRLKTQYPNSQYTVQVGSYIDEIEKQTKLQNANVNIKVGDEAPEIELADVNGTIRKLSSLRGKVVLLDFWASWCRPCRMENPNVVEAYKKLHDKGFEVFSVSLDGLGVQARARFEDQASLDKAVAESKDRWLSAIKQDGLVWENHVSDLKQWDCVPAQFYGVSSIPATFLIGKDGKIIALNPRGKGTLEKELAKVL